MFWTAPKNSSGLKCYGYQCGCLYMEYDYKMLIAIAALSLSIYNFFSNRRISNLEKKTQVLAEVGEVHMFMVEAHNIYVAFANLNIHVDHSNLTEEKSIKLNKSVVKCRDSLKESMGSVSKMFEDMHLSDSLTARSMKS